MARWRKGGHRAASAVHRQGGIGSNVRTARGVSAVVLNLVNLLHVNLIRLRIEGEKTAESLNKQSTTSESDRDEELNKTVRFMKSCIDERKFRSFNHLIEH